jgi:hypothetical protein
MIEQFDAYFKKPIISCVRENAGKREVAKHGKGMLIVENYKSMDVVVAAVVGEPMKKH